MEALSCWFSTISDWLEAHSGAITAIATVFIAWFTIALACSTKRLWRESRIASRISSKSASAAKKSADALALIERAYVFLESAEEINKRDTVTTALGHDGIQVGTMELSVQFTFKNHGKTPAILKEIFGDIRLCKDFSEAIRPRGTPLAPGQVIGASDNKSFTQTVTVDPTEYKFAKETGKPTLLLFGAIHYADVLKEPRYTEFCWKFDIKGREFRPALDPERNKWT